MSSQSIDSAQPLEVTPFTLQPFGGEHPDIAITGEILRQGNSLQLSYKLAGELSQIQLPGLTAMPLRRNELWQHSCFEFFLGIQGDPGYWEINLSPSGDWNIYRLSSYRENLTPEPAYDTLPFNVIVTDSACILSLDFALGDLVSADQAIEVGMTTVVEEKPEPGTTVGRISYWAIAHTAPVADFHRRDSFTIQLPGI